jgi:hypothetical protein
LVVRVSRHRGRGHRSANAGERFVGLIASWSRRWAIAALISGNAAAANGLLAKPAIAAADSEYPHLSKKAALRIANVTGRAPSVGRRGRTRGGTGWPTDGSRSHGCRCLGPTRDPDEEPRSPAAVRHPERRSHTREVQRMAHDDTPVTARQYAARTPSRLLPKLVERLLNRHYAATLAPGALATGSPRQSRSAPLAECRSVRSASGEAVTPIRKLYH